MAHTTVYSFPTLLDFGANATQNLPAWIEQRGGAKVLLVTDPGIPSLPLFGQVTEVLNQAGVPWELFSDISPDPRDRDIHKGARAFRAAGCDIVVGLGGGSALDGAKGIKLMATHDGAVVDYDDATGGDAKISDNMPPFIAIPTTAGTGSEVGRAFVVVDTARNAKMVVFSPYLMPDVAILDPTLHVGMPGWLTAATGLDALTHCVEALVARGFHPMADSIALGGIRLVARSLGRAFQAPDNLDARGEMALAAAMGATAFQKGLGVIHSLAHPCSTIANVHHGLANGVLLEAGMRFNADVSAEALARMARAIGLASGATLPEQAEAAIAWAAALRDQLEVPSRLSEVGVSAQQLDQMGAQAFADGCHQSNPKPVSREDIDRLYRETL